MIVSSNENHKDPTLGMDTMSVHQIHSRDFGQSEAIVKYIYLLKVPHSRAELETV